jgi:hypothetical protein
MGRKWKSKLIRVAQYEPPRQLYWAYGSNLNIGQMRVRCPAARMVGALTLPNAQLVFRGVADVEYAKGVDCPGGLWRITTACEAELDRYEGIKSGLYRKVYDKVLLKKTGETEDMLVYQMNSTGIMPPSQPYLNSIVQGYRDFGLDLDYLGMAIERAWGDMRITPKLRKRRAKQGNSPFALVINPCAVLQE